MQFRIVLALSVVFVLVECFMWGRYVFNFLLFSLVGECRRVLFIMFGILIISSWCLWSHATLIFLCCFVINRKADNYLH
jgi:hypothetical protein